MGARGERGAWAAELHELHEATVLGTVLAVSRNI